MDKDPYKKKYLKYKQKYIDLKKQINQKGGMLPFPWQLQNARNTDQFIAALINPKRINPQMSIVRRGLPHLRSRRTNPHRQQLRVAIPSPSPQTRVRTRVSTTGTPRQHQQNVARVARQVVAVPIPRQIQRQRRQPPVRIPRQTIRNASIILQNGDDILFVHDRRGYWVVPGGGINPGETPFHAASREFKEETGGIQLPHCFNGPNIPYEDFNRLNTRVYVCKTNANKTIIKNSFKPNSETDQAEWFNKNLVRYNGIKNIAYIRSGHTIRQGNLATFNWLYNNKRLD